MRKSYILLCVSLLLLCLSGCAHTEKVEFADLYHQVIGFSDTGGFCKPVPQDAVLLMTPDDFKGFTDKYFALMRSQIGTPDDGKAVIYIQLPSDSPTTVTPLYVKGIEARGNKLTVKTSPAGRNTSSQINVDPVAGFNGVFKWVIFVEVDKANLKSDMEIDIVQVSP